MSLSTGHSNCQILLKVIYKKLRKFFKFFLVAYLGIWILKATFVSVYRVPSKSMASTIIPGSYVVIIKWPYRFTTPDYWPFTKIQFPFFSTKGLANIKKGDVIVFNDPLSSNESHPSDKAILIKRCVGIKGDTVQIYKKMLRVNGKVIDQKNNTMLFINYNNEPVYPLTSYVGNYSYYVLGDNRLQSFDSRYFGSVPEENLIGKVVAVIWPLPPKWL